MNAKHIVYKALILVFLTGSSLIHAQEAPEIIKPMKKQLEFADWEVGAFIHYGLNVYTGQEHGDGRKGPENFNPTELDCEQWVKAAKAMGAKYACLTVRHEGGFCLWPSKATEYTIANSPYKNGKGDIAKDFVKACRKHGLKVGFYHTSSHDAHHSMKNYDGEITWGPQWDEITTEAFKDSAFRAWYKHVQMEEYRELLTNYGPIDYMWSDHWNAADPDGVWRAITHLAAELQPDMVLHGPETWVPGNESGHVVYPMWNALNTIDGTMYTRPAAEVGDQDVENDYGLRETAVRAGNPYGKFWRVRECTTHWAFHTGGWFWHPGITYPLPLSDHVNLYYRTVGLGANTIINLPPDNRGLVPEEIVEAAERFGKEIERRFANPIATMDEVTKDTIVEIDLVKVQKVNTIVTMENIANGQRVAEYTLEYWRDGQWKRFKPMNYFLNANHPYRSSVGYETIGHKKIDRVATVETDRIRFRCLESVSGTPEIRSMAVHYIMD